MSEHTPGPWKRGQVRPIWGTLLVDSIGMGIDQTREANARLIAAAPELLAAVRVALGYLGVCHLANLGRLTDEGATIVATTIEQAEKALRAAIRKATGGDEEKFLRKKK